MTARKTAGVALRMVGASFRRAPRIIRHPSQTATELSLAVLEASRPFTPGVSKLCGLPVRYTHPQSFVVQYETIFRLEVYALRPRRPDPVIFDCGANIGLASIYWLSRYPCAQITCFEPDPSIATALRGNLETAWTRFGRQSVELEPDTTTPPEVPSMTIGSTRVIEAAVWTAAGALSFHQQGAGGGYLGDGELIVPTIRLADYLEARLSATGEPIDLLKIDIEGAEVDVLMDCAPFLRSVEALFVEFHSIVGRPQRFDELIGVLARANFRLTIETEFSSRHPFIARDPHGGMDLQLNVYAYREGPS